MKTVQFIIDPQNDFMNSPEFKGALAVNGAYEDMIRLKDHIEKTIPEQIVVTLDTHSRLDIAHHLWWIDQEGKNPAPFTIITVEDVKNGKWRAKDDKEQEYSLYYVEKLKENNKYQLMVWPDHCIDGTIGHKVNPELLKVLENWEIKTNKKVMYVNKGTNPKTEHYSGLKAEVVLDGAKETELNVELIQYLNKFDKIEVSGEAISHCVGSSLGDLLKNLPEGDRNKVVVLKNCTSPVTGFEKQGEMFLSEAQRLGATLQDTITNKKYKI